MPDSSPAAGGPPLPLAPAAPQMIAHGLIEISPLNPRKDIAPEDLAALAESIAAHGLLQNLVLRPHPRTPGRFEIVAGERRWRAVDRLIRDGKLKPDHALPAAIRAVDDTEMMLLAGAENIARADLSPLEEARLFKRLLAAGVPKVEIARRVGRTTRFIDLRLDLVERLAEPGQKALQAGDLTLEQARVIARAPKDRQQQIVKEAKPRPNGGHLARAEDLLQAVRNAQVPVEAALFDLKDYTGAIATPDGGGQMFDDVAQFARLQEAALKKLKAELLKKWPWVDRRPSASHGGSFNHVTYLWPYEKAKHEKAGALILVPDNKGPTIRPVVVEGVVKRDDPKKGGRSDSAPRAAKPDPAKEKARKQREKFATWCRDFKDRRLQAWLLDHPAEACALAVGWQVDLASHFGHNGAVTPAAKVALKRAAGLDIDDLDEAQAPERLAKLAKRGEKAMPEAMAAAVACSICVRPHAWHREDVTGDAEADVRLYRALGFDPLAGWSMTVEFLDVCPDDVVRRIWGAAGGPDEQPGAKALRAALLKLPEAKTYRPPWLELATPVELVEKLKPAAVKPKAKGKR